MVILPQCRANLMIGTPGKTWGAFFSFFSVIALQNGDFTTVPCQLDDWKAWKKLRRVFAFFQRHRCNACVVKSWQSAPHTTPTEISAA